MKKALFVAILFLLPALAFASIDVNLKYGNIGSPVVELQEFLISKGFLTGEATGNFYSLTRKAVIAYQSSIGLPATGFVGPLTRAEINRELNQYNTLSTNQEIVETGTTSPVVVCPNGYTCSIVNGMIIANPIPVATQTGNIGAPAPVYVPPTPVPTPKPTPTPEPAPAPLPRKYVSFNLVSAAANVQAMNMTFAVEAKSNTRYNLPRDFAVVINGTEYRNMTISINNTNGFENGKYKMVDGTVSIVTFTVWDLPVTNEYNYSLTFNPTDFEDADAVLVGNVITGTIRK